MIRIGIVGCGRILAAHLEGYRVLRQAGFDQFRITALCARKADDAKMYAKRGEGPPQRKPVSDIPGDPLAIGDQYLSDFQDDVEVEIFTDYREMIESGKIDAVNDFTSHSMHHLIAEHCFQHGKHLLSQKPLAVSIAAAKKMVEQAKAADVTFAVFENFRNAPQTRHLGWLFQQAAEGNAAEKIAGNIGNLQMILLGFIGQWWAPNRIVAETPWRHDLSQAGGITLDLGVHFLDQMRYVAGEAKSAMGTTSILEPERVTINSTGEVTETIFCDADDTFMAIVIFQSGVPANLFASWGGHGDAYKVAEGTIYYGSQGRVTGDQITYDDGSAQSLRELYECHAPKAMQEQHFPRGITNGFALNQLDWLQAIEEHRTPETSGEEGLRDLAAAFAILESHHSKQQVAVEEVLSGEIREYQSRIDKRFTLS